MNVSQAFENRYQKPPLRSIFTPYRVCPLGAHSDHQLGKITGFAIDKGIRLAYAPKESAVVELSSLQFEGCVRFSLLELAQTKQGDWADPLRGAALALARRYPLHRGLSAVIGGEFPIGGLSSSAAVTLSFLTALAGINGIVLRDEEKIALSQEAENQFLGVSCGRLDQSCEVYCRKDHLLYMDLKQEHRECIPKHPEMKPFQIAVFFSGLEQALTESAYNLRVEECRNAAKMLLRLGGLEQDPLGTPLLRDVPRQVYEQHKQALPLPWRLRTEHWYTEFQRVEQGVQAWREGDVERFGRLCFESGRSSVDCWQTGAPQLKKLYEILTETEGIYGGRFSGAGFKGCCMALVDPAQGDRILAQVKQAYLRAYPQLEKAYTACVCNSADGVGAGEERGN